MVHRKFTKKTVTNSKIKENNPKLLKRRSHKLHYVRKKCTVKKKAKQESTPCGLFGGNFRTLKLSHALKTFNFLAKVYVLAFYFFSRTCFVITTAGFRCTFLVVYLLLFGFRCYSQMTGKCCECDSPVDNTLNGSYCRKYVVPLVI